jgi:hypothetical protein
MQRTHFFGTMVATLVLGLAAAGPAAGAFVTPADLSPGDQYRLAFVTDGLITAESPDIAVYNDFVTTAANSQLDLRGLGTTWTAIASTPTVSARTNTGTDPNRAVGVPIYRLDARRIADDYVDLWDGALMYALKFSETRKEVNSEVWTGTSVDGTGAQGSELGPELGGVDAIIGLSYRNVNFNAPQWIHYDFADTARSRHMYGMSGILTVPVAPIPIPATVYLFGSAIAGLGSIGWRRRAAA